MATIQPKGENLRKAVQWIAEERQSGEKSLGQLIEAACGRFNLSPKDAEFLNRNLKSGNF